MNFRRTLSLVIPLALLVVLTSCEDESSNAADADRTTSTTTTTRADTGVDATTTDAPGGDETSSTDSSPVSSTPPTATAPTSAPSVSAPSDPPAGGGSTDSLTLLDIGAPAAAPAGTTVSQTIKGEATISIDGAFPLSLSGGLCSFVDQTLYIQAGDVSGDFITLSYIPRDTSVAAITDTSTITDVALGWQAGPNKTAAAYPAETDIIFDGAGISGSFAGVAVLAGASIPTQMIEFGGRFSCLPAPFQIRGAHGLNLTAAVCNSAGSYVSAGTPTGDGALLAFDPASLSAGDRSTDAALEFRVGTVVYTSIWALAEIDPDGLGATFTALVAGPDGIEFLVQGGFSCL